jgi:hypothetical protein
MDLQAAVQQVREHSANRRPRSTVDLPLPIHDGLWVGRFRVLDLERIEEFDAAVDSSSETEATQTFVADALLQILMRPARGAEPEPVTDGGQPVRFDEAFAAALGLELDEESDIAVVRAVWSVEDEDGTARFNAMALDRFAGRLFSWMENTSAPIAGELLGESVGGRL